MLRVLLWFLLDGLFINILVKEWGGLGGYAILILAIVAFFTFELVMAFKQWLKK